MKSEKPKVFVTIPTIAEGVSLHPQKVARELGAHGINPDGVVRHGERVIPIFNAGRLPAINSALTPQT